MKKKFRTFFLILFLGLVLRCLFITGRGITYDDAFSMLLARQDLTNIVSGTAADTMPPLFYFVLHYWMGLFDGIWWCRVLSVLFSLGGMIFIFLLVNELAGYEVAAWTAVLTAFSPFQIYHAQDIRMYAFLQFTQMAYMYCFALIYMRKRTNWLLWVLFILSGVLSLYIHNLAIFFLAIPNLFLLLQRKWRFFAKVLCSQFVMGILFIPWLFNLPGQIEKIQTAFWTPQPKLLEIVQAIIIFTGSLTLRSGWLVVISIFSLSLFFLFMYLMLRHRTISSEMKHFFLTAIFGLPLILFFLSYLMRPIFVPRAFLVSSLFYYASLAFVAVKMQHKISKYAFLAVPLLISLISLPNIYKFDLFPRSPFLDALTVVEENSVGDEVILHDNKLSYFPSYIYRPDIPQSFLADTPGSANDTFAPESQNAMKIYPAFSTADAVGEANIINFIVFRKTISEYEEMGFPEHPVIEYFDEGWQLLSWDAVGDLEIYKFRRSDETEP